MNWEDIHDGMLLDKEHKQQPTSVQVEMLSVQQQEL